MTELLQNKIIAEFTREKHRISRFLNEKKMRSQDKNAVFFELVFCIAVPQSKAPVCRECISRLVTDKSILKLDRDVLARALSGIRFPQNKARFIVEAREKFDHIYDKISELKHDPEQLREWLHDNVKGIGMKEASHFLRNIGLGEDMAILDIHILRTMQELGLIESMKLTKKRYFENEKMFQNYALQLGLKPAELDIAIWLMRSGNQEMV
jgi:N-glycosylase/DNA lyase